MSEGTFSHVAACLLIAVGLLKGAQRIYHTQKTNVYQKAGGFKQAKQDFMSLHPQNIERFKVVLLLL